MEIRVRGLDSRRGCLHAMWLLINSFRVCSVHHVWITSGHTGGEKWDQWGGQR